MNYLNYDRDFATREEFDKALELIFSTRSMLFDVMTTILEENPSLSSERKSTLLEHLLNIVSENQESGL
jgi:BMFP domain-containing protein YqiC